MKSKEELTGIRSEVTALSKKLAELSDDELGFVAGGTMNEEELARIRRAILVASGSPVAGVFVSPFIGQTQTINQTGERRPAFANDQERQIGAEDHNVFQ